MKSSRRKVLVGIAAGMAAPAILHWPAGAAEFTYKCGTSLPDAHPMAIRVRQAMQKIKEESGGRLEFTLYTNSVLGGDTAMVSQAIAGALEMYTLPLDLLAPKNEACGIFGVGFAFANYDHIWEAMDGELGNYLRGLAEQVSGLNMVKWSSERTKPEFSSQIEADAQAANSAGFTGTPSFLIGHTGGATKTLEYQSLEDPSSFNEAIEKQLKA